MKRIISLLLFFFCLGVCLPARASHIYGADFYYTHIAGNTYSITLAIYGDCSGSAFPNLPSSTAQVSINNGGQIIQTVNLGLTGPGVEVTPVCPSQWNNTSCKSPPGTVPGVTRFIFSTTVTLPFQSAFWRFRFDGSLGAGNQAGRTNSISNIFIPAPPAGGSLMVLEAELNNVGGGNSSPTFTTLPTPFYCVNIPQQYNQGAVDANNDSLSFSLAEALTTNGPATYIWPYTAAAPLSTVPGSFSFNGSTGQLAFTPDAGQQSTVVNKVVEYRNGVKVGSAMREMNFIVLTNCNNNPPSGGISNTASSPLYGGQLSGTTVVLCEGTDSIAFHIKPADPENDKVKVTLNGLPPGAATSVSGNNTQQPDIFFSWKTLNVAPGFYTFYVNLIDEGCPLSSQQTQAFSIQIVKKPTFSYKMLTATNCVGPAALDYYVDNGVAPRTIVIRQNGNIIKTSVTSDNTIRDTLSPGSYTVNISSTGIPCASDFAFMVVDSGKYPYLPEGDSAFYCLNDPPVPLSAVPATNASLQWFDISNNPLATAPSPSTTTAGIYYWLVSQKYKVCESDKDTVPVYVTKRPLSAFNILDPFCARDTMTVTFTGSIGVGPIIDYLWDWAGANSVAGDVGGPYRVVWDTPGTKTIRLQVLENKCPGDLVQQDITIKPTPVAAISAADVCARSILPVQYNATELSGQTFAWTFDGANIPSSNERGPFELVWNTPGDRRIYLTVALDGCKDTVSRALAVFPKPDATILDTPAVACLGDKILLRAMGGDTYTWLPKDRLFYEPDSTLYTRAMVPVTYTVYAANTYGCKDTDTYDLRTVEPCCTFSYPNAFTPNGDGHNDRFRLLLYGNANQYALSIYNRWGQRVFFTFDARASWDGTLNGEPCEMGTYMYYLKARCMTGHEEEQTGDIMLIR